MISHVSIRYGTRIYQNGAQNVIRSSFENSSCNDATERMTNYEKIFQLQMIQDYFDILQMRMKTIVLRDIPVRIAMTAQIDHVRPKIGFNCARKIVPNKSSIGKAMDK